MLREVLGNGTMLLDWSKDTDPEHFVGAVNGWEYTSHGDVGHHKWRPPASHTFPYRDILAQPTTDFLGSTTISAEFERLVDNWLTETIISSDLTEIILNRSYQRVIGLGPAVIPLVVARLRDHAEPWYWALQSLTGHEPQGVDDGDFQSLRREWLNWARDHGLL